MTTGADSISLVSPRGGPGVRDEHRREGSALDMPPVSGNRLMSRRDSKMLEAHQAQLAERDRVIEDLRERNAELERYAYTVSHDLKAPLVTIKGFVSFLRRDIRAGDDDRIEHDLGRISYATDRMQRLLDDLLELARIGRVGKKPRQIAFADVVDEALDRVTEATEECPAEIRVSSSLPEIYGDKSLLVDLLEQLLDNAMKHIGEQPTPCIEIGARRRAPRSMGPAFFVRDNGPGIHPRYHDRVFGLFERLDPDASEGTGVGLTLAKRIVEFHGGKIWIESSGGGTTMCFTLPAPNPKPSV